jgi:Bromodomain
MAAPILNDVNAHKLAGIFAKPLTERDAPGYKDLIYRPQDLKSIRAAVARGSRAANSAIEETETKAEGGGTESPARAGASGSVLVKKTEDLVPPKGIVNSAQLEMEFMRVFANAVMFNPLPPSERGLPPHLDMQRDGPSRASRKSETGEEDAEKKGWAPEEEGGIIHDTREMFESVEKAVAQWRSVEQGFVDDAPRSSVGIGLGLRGGSVSVSDVVGDESAQEDGETLGVAGGRKRRRLVE